MKMKGRFSRLAFAAALLVVVGLVCAAPVVAKPAPTGKVNLNSASAQQLTTLPGVGEKLAARIIEYRQKSAFRSIQELINVKGIGEKNFAKLQPYIVVGEPHEAPKAAPQKAADR
jgi:competence protein ComEA